MAHARTPDDDTLSAVNDLAGILSDSDKLAETFSGPQEMPFSKDFIKTVQELHAAHTTNDPYAVANTLSKTSDTVQQMKAVEKEFLQDYQTVIVRDGVTNAITQMATSPKNINTTLAQLEQALTNVNTVEGEQQPAFYKEARKQINLYKETSGDAQYAPLIKRLMNSCETVLTNSTEMDNPISLPQTGVAHSV